jgi:hypothetical protein
MMRIKIQILKISQNSTIKKFLNGSHRDDDRKEDHWWSYINNTENIIVLRKSKWIGKTK